MYILTIPPIAPQWSQVGTFIFIWDPPLQAICQFVHRTPEKRLAPFEYRSPSPLGYNQNYFGIWEPTWFCLKVQAPKKRSELSAQPSNDVALQSCPWIAPLKLSAQLLHDHPFILSQRYCPPETMLRLATDSPSENRRPPAIGIDLPVGINENAPILSERPEISRISSENSWTVWGCNVFLGLTRLLSYSSGSFQRTVIRLIARMPAAQWLCRHRFKIVQLT